MMRIDQSLPPPRPPAIPVRHGDGARGHGPSWDAVVGLLDPATTKPPELAVAEAIGGSAVRFDARPLVAPSAVALADVPIEQRPASGSLSAAEALPLDPRVLRAAVAGADALPIPIRPHGTPARHDPPDVAGSNDATRKIAHDAFSLQPPTGRSSEDLAAKRLGVRSKAVTRPMTAGATHAAPRVIASADEVRIVLRGTRLGADDRAALVRTAADALAGTSLAGRPIRVIDRGTGA